MKDYRENELKYLLTAYIILFFLWCTGIFQNILYSTDDIFSISVSVIESVAISGILSVITFVVDSLFSSNQKDKLVGLFIIPRPGNTIFTRISHDKIVDERFLGSEAKKQYENIIVNLPISKKERYMYENAHWYKIYYRYQEKGSVFQAHKDYLLCRDLFVETIVFLLFYIASLFVFSEAIHFSISFILSLVFFAVITNLAAQNKMNRFVNNVIASDIASIAYEGTD